MNLQEFNHDEHLWVRWHENPLTEGESTLHFGTVWQEGRKAHSRQENYGFRKLESL
jgi:hypothetical protein